MEESMINAPINAMPAMPVAMQPAEQTKQFNAVAITVHNPTVEAGTQGPSPYNYPQASVYSYPQTSVYQPAAPVNAPAAQEVQQSEQFNVPEPAITPAPAQENAVQPLEKPAVEQ